CDEFLQRRHRLLSLRTTGHDTDRTAGTGGQHHQAHDRRPTDPDPVALDLHGRIEFTCHLHKLGRGAGMKATLIDDGDFANNGVGGVRAHFPVKSWLATLMYLRPATWASSSAVAMSPVLRTLESLMSIGRFMPAMTSTRPASITEMARFDGVPPNMSVRTMTPAPRSARATASAMSRRRCSISSSAPMATVSKLSCGPTTCSSALRNSSASRPCVTSTSPIIIRWLPSSLAGAAMALHRLDSRLPAPLRGHGCAILSRRKLLTSPKLRAWEPF